MSSKLQMAIVIAAVLIPTLFFYAIENPASTVAYVLFIEPSYVKKRVGYPMMDFRSYNSVKEVETDLRALGFDFTALAKNLSEGKSLPPYKLYTIEVDHYMHLGYPGRLTMVLFNNRLSQLIFYPDQPAPYKIILQKKTNRVFKERTKNRIYQYVTLSIGNNKDDKTYFKWEDQRLMAEQKAWTMRHS